MKTIHPAGSPLPFPPYEIQIDAFIETHADPSVADIAYSGTTMSDEGGGRWARRVATREAEGGWRTGRNNRAVYKPVVRRSVFRLCIKMTDNSRSYAGRLESSRCGDNDASPRPGRAALHVIRAADINFYFPTCRPILGTCVASCCSSLVWTLSPFAGREFVLERISPSPSPFLCMCMYLPLGSRYFLQPR